MVKLLVGPQAVFPFPILKSLSAVVTLNKFNNSINLCFRFSMSGLNCNNIMCRDPLGNSKVYVTYCSHIFCRRCGEMVEKNLTCGACRADLTGEWRVVKVQQEPVEEWKSLVLAGLHPTIILEIATKALAFHYGQVQLECKFVQDKVKRANKRLGDVKNYYQQVVEQMQLRIKELQLQVAQFEGKMNQEAMRTDYRNGGSSLNIGSRPSQGISSGAGSGSSYGLSCGFGRGSRLTSSYLGNPLGGGGGGGNVKMVGGGGNDVRMVGGGNDYPLGKTRACTRKHTESLASVMRSAPVARISGRPRSGKLF